MAEDPPEGPGGAPVQPPESRTPVDWTVEQLIAGADSAEIAAKIVEAGWTSDIAEAHSFVLKVAEGVSSHLREARRAALKKRILGGLLLLIPILLWIGYGNVVAFNAGRDGCRFGAPTETECGFEIIGTGKGKLLGLFLYTPGFELGKLFRHDGRARSSDSTSTSSPVQPPVFPTSTPVIEALRATGATGADSGVLCPEGLVLITSEEKRQVLDYWNFSAETWNTINASIDALNAAVPAPFTYDNALNSQRFRAAAAAHLSVVNREINALVARRAADIPDRVRPMSLREGDLYDLERLVTDYIVRSLNAGDPSLWNASVDLQGRTEQYMQRAEAEILAVCDYLGAR